MAFEIKTMDVANAAEGYFIELYGSFGWRLKSSQRVFNKTSRPVATIGNGSVNYVHTQTETVDFTKLVFERDTSMENYERLESLESQYFALQSMMPEEEPIIKSNVTFEEWLKHHGKDYVTTWKTTMKTFIAAAIFSMVGIVILSMILDSVPISELADYLLADSPFFNIFSLMAAGAFVGGIISFLLSHFVYRPYAYKKAVKDPSSEGYAELENTYKRLHAEAVAYGENKARKILILAEAARLAKLVK